MQTITDLLKQHKLRKTQIREVILGKFLTAGSALTHSELEQALAGEFDRVTIYRTLKSFDEKGLIHKVIDDEAVVKYAICDELCDEHEHHDHHAHFKCDTCKQTICLHHIHVNPPTIPNGYIAKDYQLLIRGICKNCNWKLSEG